MKQILVGACVVLCLSACSFTEANRGSGRKTANNLTLAQQTEQTTSQPKRGDGRREMYQDNKKPWVTPNAKPEPEGITFKSNHQLTRVALLYLIQSGGVV